MVFKGVAKPSPPKAARRARSYWKCQCLDYEYRGQFKSPPHCKHIVGVQKARRGETDGDPAKEYVPVFANKRGVRGYKTTIEVARNVLRTIRAWDVRSARTADVYQVLRFPPDDAV